MAALVEGIEGLRSVPALLRRNAREFAGAPAYREKEYGIWQSWTWAEAEAEIEAFALGLLNLGVALGTRTTAHASQTSWTCHLRPLL